MNSPITFRNRTTLTEDVTQHIISLIANGEIKPGEKLPSERELSAQLSVSRSSVREALQALAMMRLIDIKTGRGAFVRRVESAEVIDSRVMSRLIEGDSLRELAEARRLIEVDIAQVAAERRTQDDLRSMCATLTTASSESVSAEALVASDLDFHLQIAKATHNGVLLKMFSSIFPLLGESRAKIDDVQDARAKVRRFHQAIYAAIERQDAAAAAQTMAEHLSELWHDADSR